MAETSVRRWLPRKGGGGEKTLVASTVVQRARASRRGQLHRRMKRDKPLAAVRNPFADSDHRDCHGLECRGKHGV